MEKTIKGLIIFLIISYFLVGCQATPESDIVLGKNENWIEEIENCNNIDENEFFLRNGENISFNLSTTNQTIVVDAKLNIPESKYYPIVYVSPLRFTQNQVDTAIEILMKNQSIYECREIMTKEEIEDFVVILKQKLTTYNDEGESLLYEEPEENIEYAIKYYEVQYLTAPDTIEDELVETNISEYEEDNVIIRGEVLLDVTEDYQPYISINASYSENSKNSIYFIATSYSYSPISDYDINVADYEDYFNVSQEYCKDIADSFLKSMNINDMNQLVITPVISSQFSIETEDDIKDAVTSSSFAFQLEYYREYNGIPLTIDTTSISKTEFSNQYTQLYPYEKITFIIDASGIVSLKMLGPLEIGEVLCDNSTLMGIDNILEIAKNQLILSGEKYTEYTEESLLYVTDIKLGYMRVKLSESFIEYVLLPVWDFYGYVDITYINPETNEEENYSIDLSDESMLTINAIDGTRINREYGY